MMGRRSGLAEPQPLSKDCDACVGRRADGCRTPRAGASGPAAAPLRSPRASIAPAIDHTAHAARHTRHDALSYTGSLVDGYRAGRAVEGLV